ncbi:hypothetical protein NBT05_15635 [Aquimarina sp. ERC-38]|nr:hypothetical protein [Aquimarina sp. ERC-38]UZO80375.1 hypothetical protein NBT05_15635 [Aquimarina sp. ERC-38]
MATEILSKYGFNKEMIFGILEADNEDIWIGALDGVYRYNKDTIHAFKG